MGSDEGRRERLREISAAVITANVTDLVDLDAIEPRLSSRCGAGIVIRLTGGYWRTTKAGQG
jgi:hypothetical protein